MNTYKNIFCLNNALSALCLIALLHGTPMMSTLPEENPPALQLSAEQRRAAAHQRQVQAMLNEGLRELQTVINSLPPAQRAGVFASLNGNN